MSRAGLDEQLLADPDAQVRASAFMEMVRCAKDHSHDPALGLELACLALLLPVFRGASLVPAFHSARVLLERGAAIPSSPAGPVKTGPCAIHHEKLGAVVLVDLREHGFWGYAVVSSASLRERIEAHLRYQSMRTPWRIVVGLEAGAVRIELVPQHIPEDVLPIVTEWLIATALLHFADHLGHRARGLTLQLSYSEQPHHRELAALFEGDLRFDAPCIALIVPPELLNTALQGDRKLQRLTQGQLDAQLAAFQSDHAETPRPLLQRAVA